MTRYCDIEPLCRPDNRFNTGPPLRGCPYDGLGCTGGEYCSINDPDLKIGEAYNMDLKHFKCWKRSAVPQSEKP